MNTGVYDVNGNEIKVGDIVHYRGDNLSAIVWKYSKFCYNCGNELRGSENGEKI